MTRNASFELLRLICMFMIVLYQIIIKVNYPIIDSEPFQSTIVFPLHIPVICFILISGYFGIKVSMQKVQAFFIQTRIICWLASSVFSIYLIHSNQYVESILWHKIEMVTDVCWLR